MVALHRRCKSSARLKASSRLSDGGDVKRPMPPSSVYLIRKAATSTPCRSVVSAASRDQITYITRRLVWKGAARLARLGSSWPRCLLMSQQSLSAAFPRKCLCIAPDPARKPRCSEHNRNIFLTPHAGDGILNYSGKLSGAEAGKIPFPRRLTTTFRKSRHSNQIGNCRPSACSPGAATADSERMLTH
jgi:hypothetical protein